MKPENIVNSFRKHKSEYEKEIAQMSEEALTALTEAMVCYAITLKEPSKGQRKNVSTFLECEAIPGRALIAAIRTLVGSINIVSEKIALRLGDLLDTNPELWIDEPEEVV